MTILRLLLMILPGLGVLSLKAGQKDTTINVALIKAACQIGSISQYYSSEHSSLSPRQIFALKYEDSIPSLYRMKIPSRDITKDFFLKFRVSNNSSAGEHCYFLPGFYLQEIDLYKQTKGDTAIRMLAKGNPLKNKYKGLVGFYVAPGEECTIIARLKFVRTTVNYMEPRIIKEFFLPVMLSSIRNSNKLNQAITYTTAGVLMMMCFYSLAVFFLNTSKDFILYCAHAFFLSLLFFLKALLYRVPTEFNYFFESYFDFVIQSAGFYFFLFFLRKFTGSKEKYPVIEKILLYDQVFTVIGVCLFSYLYFFTKQFVPMNTVEIVVKYSWSLTAASFIVFALIEKQKLLNFIAMGHFLLLISVVISLYLIDSDNRFGTRVPPLLNDSLFYYEMGVVSELIFFLIALAYKNRQDITAAATEKERLLLAHERNELEKHLAIIEAQQAERNRISADMHDELGSGVTAIRLMSELVKAKMKENTLPEVDKISASANDLINKMNTIIWTMKSTNDSLDNLAAYIRSYTLEFFENTNIDCCFIFPPAIPAIELSGEKRRNIFLCVKETLNNTVKYACATRVILTMHVNENLKLIIKDNGTGINTENIRQFGNGIANMKKRMESIEGIFDIYADAGTVTILSLKLEN